MAVKIKIREQETAQPYKIFNYIDWVKYENDDSNPELIREDISPELLEFIDSLPAKQAKNFYGRGLLK